MSFYATGGAVVPTCISGEWSAGAAGRNGSENLPVTAGGLWPKSK